MYMNYLNKIKKHPYIAVITLLITLLIIVLLLKGNEANTNNAYKVVRSTLYESIEVSGKTKPISSSELNFERSGVVNTINVKVGDKVSRGQTLASLSSVDLVAQVSQAAAALESAQANLNAIKEGARPEEIAVKEQALTSAKSDYELQQNQAIDTISNVTNSYNDILYFKLSNLFVQSGDNYKYNVNNCDQSLVSKIELNYKSAISDYNELKNIDLQSNISNMLNVLNITKNQIELKNLIANTSLAVTANCVTNDSSLTNAKSYISSAKSSLVAATTEINIRINNINTAKNAIDRAQKDLTLVSAGGDKNKIEIQRAAVSQAAAGLENARAQLAKNIIKAPYNGIVTAVNIDLGSLAVASKSAISIMSGNVFEIEIKLSEIDAAKISLKQSAEITLDAFGNDIKWSGIVTSIDPSATDNNGVSNYKATVSIIEEINKENNIKNQGDKEKSSTTKDHNIKAGMTANVKLTTNKKENVLSIPSKYIKTIGGETHVMLLEGKKSIDKKIEIGLRGDDGQVEIVSGLSEGDVVGDYKK